ncbi:hypothetical protein POV27_19875 [Aureisphaera galaxeae]|uniref:hypothetical protein n=1 Tax=Aureisphaera galaxeae TaxID=1538023 RepID=UPI00234FB73B|nr:hypothetical protein [Aureisphaera galaxeae]MDC8006323.1 hypothetical protein [Aureisphaera galaxeae]
MEQIMHRAAQYLATAAISFLEKKEDDSHTNLGWIDSLPGLVTHPLTAEGDMLALNYETFSLEWRKGDSSIHTLWLEGKTHDEVIEWIAEISKQQVLQKAYEYALHYDLPYPVITDDYTYSMGNPERLKGLVQNRTRVNHALVRTLAANGLTSDVRIWPHHFDSGGFAMANETLGIGLGMAVPDSMIDDFYLYVSGYHGHDFVDTTSFEPLSTGTVYSEGWKGIALPVQGLSEEDMLSFFNEAISRYTN